MKIRTPTEFQTFNDGLCAIYKVENMAEPGNKPKSSLKEKLKRVPYERRKLGLTRYYEALQADVKVEMVLRIPCNRSVHTNDVCMVDGEQYRISLAQEISDTLPPSTDMTLVRLEAEYDTSGIS